MTKPDGGIHGFTPGELVVDHTLLPDPEHPEHDHVILGAVQAVTDKPRASSKDGQGRTIREFSQTTRQVPVVWERSAARHGPVWDAVPAANLLRVEPRLVGLSRCERVLDMFGLDTWAELLARHPPDLVDMDEIVEADIHGLGQLTGTRRQVLHQLAAGIQRSVDNVEQAGPKLDEGREHLWASRRPVAEDAVGAVRRLTDGEANAVRRLADELILRAREAHPRTAPAGWTQQQRALASRRRDVVGDILAVWAGVDDHRLRTQAGAAAQRLPPLHKQEAESDGGGR